jgi:hypothetical protein
MVLPLRSGWPKRQKRSVWLGIEVIPRHFVGPVFSRERRSARFVSGPFLEGKMRARDEASRASTTTDQEKALRKLTIIDAPRTKEH